MIQHLDKKFKDLLIWHPHLQSYENLKRFEEAIQKKGGGALVWGFVDGTFRGFQRPTKRQQDWYSGYYGAHGFKFQAIVTPNGLVYSLIGPFHGKANDWSIFTSSSVPERIREVIGDRRILYLYGDPAYHFLFGVMPPFKHALGYRYLPRAERAFNIRLSKVRISVEHAFGRTQSLWTYTAFSKQLSLTKQPVAAFYRVAILLTNLYTCIRGNQISQKFVCKPPSVEDYLCI